MIGTTTKKYCGWKVEGQKLVRVDDPKTFAELVNGTIVWPVGSWLASTPVEGACEVKPEVFEAGYSPKCTLSWNDWEGNLATAFNYKNASTPADVQLWLRISENEWMVRGTASGDNFLKQEGDTLVSLNAQKVE